MTVGVVVVESVIKNLQLACAHTTLPKEVTNDTLHKSPTGLQIIRTAKNNI